MYIHAYIFYRNSYTTYVFLMSEAQFENVEQNHKGTGTSVSLKAVEKNDCISDEWAKRQTPFGS